MVVASPHQNRHSDCAGGGHRLPYTGQDRALSRRTSKAPWPFSAACHKKALKIMSVEQLTTTLSGCYQLGGNSPCQ